MDKTIQSFKKEISTLRTGRANPAMLDMIKADVYGQMMPINQLATISVPEARLITIQVWDKANVALIDSAIQKSDLGINPQVDGQMVRIRIPDLTEERRRDLVKRAKAEGEHAKVSVRSQRKDANDMVRSLKEEGLSEDGVKDAEEEVQKLTDRYNTKIDELVSVKEEDIMKV